MVWVAPLSITSAVERPFANLRRGGGILATTRSSFIAHFFVPRLTDCVRIGVLKVAMVLTRGTSATKLTTKHVIINALLGVYMNRERSYAESTGVLHRKKAGMLYFSNMISVSFSLLALGFTYKGRQEV